MIERIKQKAINSFVIMRTVAINIVFWFVLLILACCSKEKEEHFCFIEPSPDAYDYPIKPGTPEWELLQSSDEMDSALRIPEEILYYISTEGLIETVLNYPGFGNIYFAEDYQIAFDLMKDNFNGFSELLQRDDAAKKLKNRYILMHPGCNKNNWPSIIEPGRNISFSFAYIEILLAQYDILNQLDCATLKLLHDESNRKYSEKIFYNHSVFSKLHTVLIEGRIMYLNKYPPFLEEYNENHYVKIFIERANLLDFETLDLIHNYSDKFKNENEKY
jgi:hypothetical protein